MNLDEPDPSGCDWGRLFLGFSGGGRLLEPGRRLSAAVFYEVVGKQDDSKQGLFGSSSRPLRGFTGNPSGDGGNCSLTGSCDWLQAGGLTSSPTWALFVFPRTRETCQQR